MNNKSKLNFVIDAVMFLVLMAMAGLGFLMNYVLIPGKERWDTAERLTSPCGSGVAMTGGTSTSTSAFSSWGFSVFTSSSIGDKS